MGELKEFTSGIKIRVKYEMKTGISIIKTNYDLLHQFHLENELSLPRSRCIQKYTSLSQQII